MADSAHASKPLRVLVSEGNSTSSREAITIMGLSGHLIESAIPHLIASADELRDAVRFPDADCDISAGGPEALGYVGEK